MDNTLALILVKRYSKRVEDKAFKILYNKPLYKWTIEFLEDNKDLFKDIVLSSDFPELFKCPSNFIKIRRKHSLTLDSSLPIESIRHTINVLNKYDKTYDNVMLFQITNPFRKRSIIIEALELAFNALFDIIYSYYIDDNIRISYLHDIYSTIADEFVNVRSGNFYLYNMKYLMSNRNEPSNTSMFKIPKEYGYNINTELDFYIMESILEKIKNDQYENNTVK